MKKIIVTGGAGFLGSNLCRKLLRQGNEVFCVDNLYTGRTENIADLFSHRNFDWFRLDVREGLPIGTGKVDQIYNLACPASPPHYQKDPLYTMSTSISGALSTLTRAKRDGARILQASTSEVYGDPQVHPQTEAYRGHVNPIGIRSCYDEGKRAAESIFFDHQRMYGTDIRVMRIFNTYGPHMDPDDGRVVSNFIMQALRNEPITIYGDGEQTRSFCYVDDLLDGMIALMNTDNVTGPYNIGNPSEFTIKELAQKVIELTGTKSELVYEPLPSDDPLQRCPDITRAKKDLRWEPNVRLKEGLQKTIPYFKTQL